MAEFGDYPFTIYSGGMHARAWRCKANVREVLFFPGPVVE